MCGKNNAFSNKSFSNLPDCSLRDYLICFRPYFLEAKLATVRDSQCPRKCPKRCDQETYTTRASTSKFPSDVAFDYLVKKNFLNASDRYSEVRIYFENLVKTETIHSPVFTSDVIIGIIGGHLGFFLGASVITVIELFEFAFYVSAWIFRAKMRPKSVKDDAN